MNPGVNEKYAGFIGAPLIVFTILNCGAFAMALHEA
jgi:hypothetical protein